MMPHAAVYRASDSQPALIGIDWGTSILRADLFAADGSMIDRRALP